MKVVQINESKAGIKEYIALLMLCLGIKATDSTPVLFFKLAMNSGWMIPVISSVITFISLVCMLAILKKYKDKNIIQISYDLLGKYIGLIIGMYFVIYALLLSALHIRQYSDIMTTIYFARTPLTAVVLILTASSCIVARFGFEAICRVSWMALPWILAIVVAFLVLIYNLIKIDYLFPIGGAGIKPLIKGGVMYSGLFSEVIIFAVIFPKVKSYKIYKVSSFIGLFYGVVLITVMSAMYLMVLDYPPIIINATPFHTVARLIYGGRFISNLEAFFFLFWIIASIIRFSMYSFITTEIFSMTIKHNESKPLVIPISALIMLIALMPKNFVQNVFIVRVISLNTMWVVIYVLPIVLLFISGRKGRHRK